MRLRRILTATVVGSPRKLVSGSGSRTLWGHGRFASVGCSGSDERVRDTQTQRLIVPEATGSEEIRHRAPGEHAVPTPLGVPRHPELAAHRAEAAPQRRLV